MTLIAGNELAQPLVGYAAEGESRHQWFCNNSAVFAFLRANFDREPMAERPASAYPGIYITALVMNSYAA